MVQFEPSEIKIENNITFNLQVIKKVKNEQNKEYGGK